MIDLVSRRQLLRLAGIGGVVLLSSLVRSPRRLFAEDADPTPADGMAIDACYFVQLSDSHIGFSGPLINPDAEGTLAKAVAAVNALPHQPEFIVFTGDLTHTTDDAAVRRQRMLTFKKIVAPLKAPKVYYMPGEHDAAPDQGAAYREQFGAMHYAFDHKGIHFIVLDNVSDPGAIIGTEQLAWLKQDLAQLATDARIVVFTHRPLFDLFPQWDWATRDAQAAIDLLMPFPNVTVFYGHIHQEHHFKTGHIEHHAAHGLMFALPAPGSVPKKKPIPWDPQRPYAGLGYREVAAEIPKGAITLAEYPVMGS